MRALGIDPGTAITGWGIVGWGPGPQLAGLALSGVALLAVFFVASMVVEHARARRESQVEKAYFEQLFEVMDDIYSLLVTIDFPDALTPGLRRTTDVIRGVLEKTRGDVTLFLKQRDLEKKLDER